MIKHLLILLVCITINHTFAQQQKYKDWNATSSHTLVFELDAIQAKYAILNPNKLDTAFLFTNLKYKLHKDSCYVNTSVSSLQINNYYKESIINLKKGFFAVVNILNELNIQVNIIENAYYEVSFFKVQNEYVLYVSDTMGNVVTNATVMLDTLPCLWDKGLGGYTVKNKNIKGLISISHGNYFTFKNIYSNYQITKKGTLPPKDNYKIKKELQGYLVTNKPVYKMGDTIFWKSFFTNKRGKGIKKKMQAILTGYQYNLNKKIYTTQTVYPTTKGSHNGYFVIADSFFTGTSANYELTLVYKKKVIKTEKIRIEDYTLTNNYIVLKSKEKEYSPTQNPTIEIITLDKNKLPLLGSKINIVVKCNEILYTEKDSTQIPFNYFNETYKNNMDIDPSGYTTIEIPKTILIPAKATYTAYINITTAFGEEVNLNQYFYTNTNRNRSEVFVENDTLNLNHFFNDSLVQHKFKVLCYQHQNKEIINKTIFSPFKFKIEPNFTLVEVYDSTNKVFSYTNEFYTAPLINGKRTKDSIFITFKAYKKAVVYYKIYKNNELVALGNDTALNFKIKDKSKFSYHLQYTVLGNTPNNPKFYSKSFHFLEKELNINVTQPNSIYPGQQVKTDIWVTNAFGKPAKNVNLTAYAINSQLPYIQNPYIPYLGKIKTEKQLPFTGITVNSCNFITNLSLKKWMLNRFNLYQNPYYALMYAANGYKQLVDSVPGNLTQILLTIFKGSVPINAIIVRDSNTFIYSDMYNLNSTSKPFLTTEKYLHLNVHCKEGYFKLPKIQVYPNQKNYIGVQLDSLKTIDTSNKIRIINDSFANILAINALPFRVFNSNSTDTVVFTKNNELFKAFNYATNQSTQLIFKETSEMDANGRMYTYKETFKVIGPVTPDDKIGFDIKSQYGHPFYKAANTTYSFTVNNLISKFAELKKYYLFTNNFYWKINLLNDYIFNPYVPYKEPINTNNYYKPSVSNNYLNEYQYANYEPIIKSDLKADKIEVNIYSKKYDNTLKMWLFCKDDSSYSILNNGVYTVNYNAEILNYNFKINQRAFTNKNAHNYQLYMQWNDSIWTIKNLKIDTNHALYYFIKDNEYTGITEKDYFRIDRLAKNLNKTPMTSFLDTVVYNNFTLNTIKNLDNTTTFEGLVIGPNIKYPIYEAFVVLEEKGVFKRGAWTNYDGRFIIQNVLPGDYMLKIKAKNYHYWITYSVKITKGNTSLILAKLKPYNSFIYADVITTEEGNYDYAESAKEEYGTREMENDNFASPISKAETSSKKNGRKDNNITTTSKSLDKLSGISVRGTRNDKIGYIDFENNSTTNDDKSNEMLTLVNDYSTIAAANKTREVFKDNAYWIPNLTTNKKGYTNFTATFPDNITNWICYFPAMDNYRNSGLKVAEIKAFKPIANQMQLPAFLIEGDILTAKTTIFNYTNKPFSAAFYSIINNTKKEENLEIRNFTTKYLTLPPSVLGSPLVIETGIKLSNGYVDAEKKIIPILPATVISGISQNILLPLQATNLKANLEDVTSMVTFYNQQLQTVFSMFNQLDEFTYVDNFTLVNKLQSVLIKQSINTQLKLKYDFNTEIKTYMDLITNTQKKQGGFGLFKNTNFTDVFLTARIAEVFYLAFQMGFQNNTYYRACNYLEKQFTQENPEQKAAILYALYKCNNTNLANNYTNVTQAQLTTTGKLKLIIARFAETKKIDINAINNLLGATQNGSLEIPQSYYQNWCMPYFEKQNNTYLAWESLFLADTQTNIRNALVQGMLKPYYTNVFSYALATQAYFLETAKKQNNTFEPVLKVNNIVIQTSQYPLTYNLLQQKELQINPLKGNVYMVTNRTYKTYNPKTNAAHFTMQYAIQGKNKVDTNTYKMGNKYTLIVNVQSTEQHIHTVVNIPIPAGFEVVNKVNNTYINEGFREYLPNMVRIYFNEIPFGNYTYTLDLIAKNAGTFNTPPASVGPIYFADRYGFTTSKKWVISQ